MTRGRQLLGAGSPGAAVVAASLVASLAASLVLAGCTTSPPSLPSEEAVRADYQVLLDGTWERLALPVSTPRPGFETPELVDSSRWWTEYQSCLTTILPKQIWTEIGDDWYGISTSNPDVVTVDDQVVFYRCLTRYVDADFGVIRLLTEEHLEYLWRYYERWLIPCIEHAGFEDGLTVAKKPQYYESFVANHEQGVLWSPYDTLEFAFTPDGMEESVVSFERLQSRCGDRYDALDREHGIFG